MGNIIFLHPWILLATVSLPILWWIIRTLPPKSREIKFPAFFILDKLENKDSSIAHSPLWMLILRSLIILSFIIAFAEPIKNPSTDIIMPNNKEVLLVIDNSWASATNWQVRVNRIKDYINKAARANNNLHIITTASNAKSGELEIFDKMIAEQALNIVDRISPQPWQSDYYEADKLIAELLRQNNIARTVFFSSGLHSHATFLNRFDEIVNDNAVNTPYILRLNDDSSADDLSFSISRSDIGEYLDDVILAAYDISSNVVDEVNVNFPLDKYSHNFRWNIIPEFKERIARIEIKGHKSASSIVILNNSSNNYVVGVAANSKLDDDRQELLSDSYYVRKALEPYAQVKVDRLEELLNHDISILILVNSTMLNAEDRDSLKQWVEQGGFLVRYAGSNLAANINDELLPIRLRFGERSTSGSMTWEKPLSLSEIYNESPFFGLDVPDDVRVNSQVLADPSNELFSKTWLALEDGTPLISSDNFGKGRVVLVHTTASPRWSNFCYSGLFVETLKRMLLMSRGVSDYKNMGILNPIMLKDAFGNLHSFDSSQSLAKKLNHRDEFNLSPQNPAGIYGDNYGFEIFNLGNHLPNISPLRNMPSGKKIATYSVSGEINLKPLFIKAALILLVIETLAILWLRGIIFSLIFTALLLFNGTAIAQVQAQEEFDPINSIYLAYVRTGNEDVDRLSHNGLRGLSSVVNTRTSIRVKGVVAVDPNRSELIYYSFLYWPMSAQQINMSMQAVTNLQNYILNGGIILFDTLDQNLQNSGIRQTIGLEKLRDVTMALQIPELKRISEDNILGKSFYLLNEYPGLYAGGSLWVEKEPSPANDNITSVIIGGNNWAASWSNDVSDMARYIIEPAGEEQREMSYKFGINLMMIALTGNYKGDQIHIPHILERMNR